MSGIIKTTTQLNCYEEDFVFGENGIDFLLLMYTNVKDLFLEMSSNRSWLLTQHVNLYVVLSSVEESVLYTCTYLVLELLEMYIHFSLPVPVRWKIKAKQLKSVQFTYTDHKYEIRQQLVWNVSVSAYVMCVYSSCSYKLSVKDDRGSFDCHAKSTYYASTG